MPAAPPAQSFAIAPVGGSGVGGTVEISASGSSARYQVAVTGLRPGSTHAVHDHLGTCAGLAQSEHLTVLDIGTASMSGSIGFTTTVSSFDAGSDRIVIVYATASTGVVVGCADL